MIAAASLLVFNLALPSTWVAAAPPAVAPFKAPLMPTVVFQFEAGTIGERSVADSLVRVLAGERYTFTEDLETARAAAVSRLLNRIASFKADLTDAEYEESHMKGGIAIRYAQNIVRETPVGAPLPKATLLADQVSLYWDFGSTYAVIAISENGDVSIYGKRTGKSEVLVDTSIDQLYSEGSLFPKVLSGIIF